MRFGNFEAENNKPLGKGQEKKVFVNPQNEKRVIAKIEGPEKVSPNLLKGTFYLTKIAHLLLPKQVPEIYQAGESEDGQQTIDRRRIDHSPGHAALQATREAGGDEEKARVEMIKEMGPDMGEITMELERIGLGFNIDENVGNYSKDQNGDVYYLDTFDPWEVYYKGRHREAELSFNVQEMAEAINELPDQATKEKCEAYLSRIHVLFEEEKKALLEADKVNLPESEPGIKEVEEAFAAFEAKHDIGVLNAITTKDEALASAERAAAKKDMLTIWAKLNDLKAGTDISIERHGQLYTQYQKLYRAIGTINADTVDHTR